MKRTLLVIAAATLALTSCSTSSSSDQGGVAKPMHVTVCEESAQYFSALREMAAAFETTYDADEAASGLLDAAKSGTDLAQQWGASGGEVTQPEGGREDVPWSALSAEDQAETEKGIRAAAAGECDYAVTADPTPSTTVEPPTTTVIAPRVTTTILAPETSEDLPNTVDELPNPYPNSVDNTGGSELVKCAGENYQPGTGIFANGEMGFAAACLPGGSMAN